MAVWRSGFAKGWRVGTALALLLGPACAARDPVLFFLDDTDGMSFAHPPRWSVGVADQDGVRYRYLTAPNLDADAEALSVTLISPTPAPSAAAVAEAYLTGAKNVTTASPGSGATEWSFADASGVPSRLRIKVAEDGRCFGAWARGSERAMSRYRPALDALFSSIRVEDPRQWPEDDFAGLALRVPANWARGSRLSSATQATMQFRSPPLAVEKGTATVHGFVTLSREPVAPPGDLAAFEKTLKERTSDTVAVFEHREWPGDAALGRPPGYVDYMRSGTTVTSTRIRRWIAVKQGVGFTLSCEARTDVFDRLDPWCRRMAAVLRIP